MKLAAAIAQEGVELASYVGKVKSESDWKYKQKTINLEIDKHYEKAGRGIQAVFDTAIEDIKQEIEVVLKGNLVQTYIAYIEKSLDASVNHLQEGINIDALRDQFTKLRGIAEFAGANILQNASRGFLNTATSSGFLHSINVAGGNLHQAVLGIGKAIGFKFKPWQAVGIAKDIGNFFVLLGPILAVGALAIDIIEANKEKKLEQQMADARRQITSSFQKLAKNLEHQVEIQFYEFDKQVYGEIERMIADARKQNEEAIASSNNSMRQLIIIRQEFEAVLKMIGIVNRI